MNRLIPLSVLILSLAACGEANDGGESPEIDPSGIQKVEAGKADTSALAIIVDMAFSARMLTDSSWGPKSKIEDQMLYTIGHLNGDKAVGRLDKVVLSNVKTEKVGDRYEITYDASLQVAWPKSAGMPDTYEFILPIDMGFEAQKAFTEAYSHKCVPSSAHDVTTGSMWYYYRPNEGRCELDEADVQRVEAKVTLSDVNTTGKYPEYDRVWEDNAFIVVAIFGKYEDGTTSNSDAGIRAYNRFSRAIQDEFKDYDLDTIPADFPYSPGVEAGQITYSAKIDPDHRVIVHTILVDNVRTAGADFNEWYSERSGTADLIIYNGHAGLGSNVRALAKKGEWLADQYAMVFLNGCDSYAYIDSALFDAHSEVNNGEPGTKYVDVITNALPAFFASMSGATMALIRGMMAYDNPLTYEQMFKDVDESQLVLVSGEEDNTYVPGPAILDPVSDWDGMSLEGTVANGETQTFETDVLPAGTYTFSMTGTGDADLYIRIGLQPSFSNYDCRPYKTNSVESCQLDLPTPARVFGLIDGYKTADFKVVGAAE